ncbi:putative short chain dehydrogenase [Diaporthe ampelina]|uniref:Putative short chain dehydrogenase n=1 Tax=Diaporthe ampelina TaxID=1214573 RepID=A0A0G2FT77_9PEZI|nr:putative short chain dehydrogenase [Diaporthe ampelina]
MATPSKSFFAVVAGVGAGTGGAVAKRFAKAYPVVLLARREESFKDLVAEINGSGGRAIGIPADATDAASVKSAFDTIKNELPGLNLAAAVYNVSAGFGIKPFLEFKLEDLDSSLKGNAHGLFHFAQSTLPLLLESVDSSPHPPSLIVTGATASVRGSAKFANFAAGKFAVRAITQSLAREFGPRGVHVAHAIIDGGIDIPRLAEYKHKFNNGAPDGLISPDSIAEDYWHLHTQHRSAFTQELDLRPYVEKF